MKKKRIKSRIQLSREFVLGNPREGMYCGNLHVTRSLRTQFGNSIEFQDALFLYDVQRLVAVKVNDEVIVSRENAHRADYPCKVAEGMEVRRITHPRYWRMVLKEVLGAHDVPYAGNVPFCELADGRWVSSSFGTVTPATLEERLALHSKRLGIVIVGDAIGWIDAQPTIEFIYPVYHNGFRDGDFGIDAQGNYFVRAEGHRWKESIRVPKGIEYASSTFCGNCGRPFASEDSTVCTLCGLYRLRLGVMEGGAFSVLGGFGTKDDMRTCIETPHFRIASTLNGVHNVPGVVISTTACNRYFETLHGLFPYVIGLQHPDGSMSRFSRAAEFVKYVYKQ